MILEIKKILQNEQKFAQDMSKRGEKIDSKMFLGIYHEIRDLETRFEELSRKINEISSSGTKISEESKTISRNLDEERKKIRLDLDKKNKEFDDFLYSIPNWLDDSVPTGRDSSDNVVIYTNKVEKKDNSDHHEDIAIALGLWGRKEAVRMSGSRFIILKDKLAKLERTLAQFAIKYLTDNGFMEMSVPFVVKRDSMYNTGQLPKFSGEYFEFDDFCLISTGEIPLVNLLSSETLTDLPVKITACTPCFRKEAGSLGKDTKGLIRLHQFTKVEMVCATTEENSEKMHLEMLGHIKSILDLLQLHYRVVEVCSGDIGFTAARQFDVEVWMPSQKNYVEVASCSNCLDFQSRRMKTKYIDPKSGKKNFAHTLNSTGLACGRIIAAILENYCTTSTFKLPLCLQKLFEIL